MNNEIISVFEYLEKEKGVSRERLIPVISEAIKNASEKGVNAGQQLKIDIDPRTGDIRACVLLTVVDSVADPKTEIHVKQAALYADNPQLGDVIEKEIRLANLGRIVAQTVQQTIMQWIRQDEKDRLYSTYKDQVGMLVAGTVRRRERGDLIVELGKARQRAHILEGLLKAIDIIDEVIAAIRASRTQDLAKEALIERFGFDMIQASAIVAMRLGQLTGLEKEKLQAEFDELEKFIARCEQILASTEEQLAIVKDECRELKARYGDARRTEITLADDEFNPEDFYADEDVVITISHLGYIKRTPLAEFHTQARGGVGKKASATRDEDFIEHIYVANMHSTMLFFTDKGMCYRLKVYELPEGTRTSKGRAVQNLLSIDSGDRIRTYLNVRSIEDPEYTAGHFVTLVTRRGVVKKTALSEYSNRRSRNKGIIAISIREGDELLDALLTDGSEEIMIAARHGRCCRFKENELRALGRNSSGVRGISIEDDDEVVGAIAFSPASGDASGHSVLVVSENGYGKRSDYDEYRITARGAKGVKTINITDKTGPLVAIKDVTEDNDLMIITRSGLTIRLAVPEIRLAGRATQGVRLISIRESDSIAAVCPVAGSDAEPDGDGASVQGGEPATAEE